MNNCNNCPVNDGYKPAEAVHEIADPTPSIEAVMHDLRESHARTSKGEWSKGDTTHYTVAKRGDGKEYRIAEFRHADDAQFCDLAHAFVPRLIDEVEAQRARIAELEKENSYMNNACAELEAQIAAAQQAVQADAPLPLLLRDIARDLGITVPQACIALKPLGNYSTNSAVTAEMARMLRDHFPAPAHPAEGVLVQAAKLPPLPEPTAFLVCKGSEVTARAWNVDQMRAYAAAAAALAATQPADGAPAQEVQAAIDRFDAYFRSANGVPPNARVTVPTAEWQELRAMLSTHHAQQGMDAQDASVLQYLLSNAKYHEWDGGYRADFDISINADVNGVRAESAKEAVQNILAAQAKQGGV